MGADTEPLARRLRSRLVEIVQRDAPPEREGYMSVLSRAIRALEDENPLIRPRDSSGLPGGCLYLSHDIPTIVVPDLHARMDFFLSLMLRKASCGLTTLERLERGSVQVVCVGDGFHAERRAVQRWVDAYGEYMGLFEEHRRMDEEMRESLGVMEMVMEVKARFPCFFHFLKGNHENIANEEGEGNHPFRKFVKEGAMVSSYVWKFYGAEFLSLYYAFEKQLPLLAVGKNFLVSHAEPVMFYEPGAVLEYRSRPDVVEGLTWTDNGSAEDGSVEAMLARYLGGPHLERGYHFGGHRPVGGLYHTRSGGRYVQIHNPDRWVVAEIEADGDIVLEEDVVEIQNTPDNEDFPCHGNQSE
jgi:hypothetical protein